MWNRLALVSTMLVWVAVADAADKADAVGPRTEPKGVPLELKIVNLQKEAYELDSRGDPVFKYRERIATAEKNGNPLAATVVDMELVITNTGSAPVKIWVAGDGVVLTLDLAGNGAVNAQAKPNSKRTTTSPQTVTIAAGKSHHMPLKRLVHGVGNESTFTYITEAGLYELSASIRTGVSPAPQGSTGIGNNFGEVKLHSAPITIRVVRPS